MNEPTMNEEEIVKRIFPEYFNAFYLACCDATVDRPTQWAREKLSHATTDCPECGELLIFISEMETMKFHEYMHERSIKMRDEALAAGNTPMPLWPSNGANTGFIEIGDTDD